ncbi:MAG TPA: sigma-54-dependent Fis family transcriptional regulator, partial [Candidatus Marinimicrobia bacterium]|nr:sigma-54-dependent Fis family transcriptional regulator [Candidatus Neomarinimicrobiota bacterium]
MEVLNRILIVDDDTIFRESLVAVLHKRGYECEQAGDGQQAYEMIKQNSYDVVVTDLEMPRKGGLELMDAVNVFAPHINFIVITAYATMESAIVALRHGAFDYIVKPFKFESLIIKLDKLVQHKLLVQENARLRREVNLQYDFTNIIGQADAMKKVFKMIQLVAESDSNVMITGRSGTGKELVARAVHYNSPRRNGPFVTLNCSAVPDNLIESELFGYKRGAFTGATQENPGLFQQAQRGTIFLDEIGEVSPNFQMKLLRAIEQKEIYPLGTTKVVKLDVRIITATNKNLEKEIAEKRFREDLYYRLNVVNIVMPGLSERQGDIPLLVNHFIQKFNKAMGKNVQGMTNEAMHILQQAQWRGEVRELENVIERAMIFTDGEWISDDVLPQYLFERIRIPTPDDSFSSLDEATKQFQRNYIIGAMKKFNGHRGKTARYLSISEPTLYRRM